MAGPPIGFSSGGLGLFDGGMIGSFVETSTQMGLIGRKARAGVMWPVVVVVNRRIDGRGKVLEIGDGRGKEVAVFEYFVDGLDHGIGVGDVDAGDGFGKRCFFEKGLDDGVVVLRPAIDDEMNLLLGDLRERRKGRTEEIGGVYPGQRGMNLPGDDLA